MYVCESSVCVYLMTIIQCGKENEDKTMSSNTVGRRGNPSSPVVLCNESYLVK
ncbi:hypothetical protein EXN66_Car012315 [Channa argus]|uniref:Uncharacterized protein n=1 Tax=Channa argus TaxID=215402 RepID=A0A6G1Q2B3_CHAAH|nr:hypothetical protein EXN66_Car012315 [Channa argus]